MPRENVDLSLYVITDPDLSGDRMHAEVVRLALDGGATAIEYRDKRAPVRRQYEVGMQLRALTRERGAALIVNDRADLACALEADGVHVGPEDLPVEAVRRIVGPDMLIAASAYDVWEAQEAEAGGADYIVARPLFRTRWATEHGPAMGLEGLSELTRVLRVPVVAVGGITSQNLGEVLAAGAAGAGVSAAVVSAADPSSAARELREALNSARPSG